MLEIAQGIIEINIALRTSFVLKDLYQGFFSALYQHFILIRLFKHIIALSVTVPPAVHVPFARHTRMSQHLPQPPPLITLPLDDDTDESDDGRDGAERERALRQELLRRKGTKGVRHDDGAAGDGCSLAEAKEIKEILSDFETAREAAEWIRMHSGVLLTEEETATLERRLAGAAEQARSQSSAATLAAAAAVGVAVTTASAAVACNACACRGQFVLANYSGPTPTCFPCRQATGRARTSSTGQREVRVARHPTP